MRITVLPPSSVTSSMGIVVWEWPSMKASSPVVLAITSRLVQGWEDSSTPRWPRAMT